MEEVDGVGNTPSRATQEAKAEGWGEGINIRGNGLMLHPLILSFMAHRPVGHPAGA